MRIISGTAGSRSITVPGSVARPSTDRLREALFSILGQRVAGARVLDLFAGSGALGLECLSRGAASCDSVDASREAFAVIRKNLTALGLKNGKAIHQDVSRFLQGAGGKYDLVFADPPYYKNAADRDFVSELLQDETLPGLMADDGLLIVEDPPANQREDENGWKLLDSRRYGGCGILFYQR
ncbi:16S rRNA (guanine(966)-N(2))-methyltransferase RsmD [Verrucomicrobiaceae bacterium R5-34]|uniref:16S rRNA (Guanine(966)-N(2))-methyltransferase RsmD n=1 Tax=Oceaniferula flava TaxID=2800421 RepID=A0AAE2VA12_9BACT|nr:16S rRNA (guanine(966)-N(2))-methyltransferase RsmD [Oceaniferula flavus]MBK1831768.1 16S rRNA (guanine(966)-N(2))-methyltransferase RsmD [Verrucomicrobiaceae bacterium R5-34]MBK1856093.1 16S rRNA (guanine(966)-N(2))-methyltransferase RsmD [Oceaniferula flavus]MBM1137400.1 16S rRNA (guanine(966)-N(2))-methyltransferase RsmD [Oceaniferula flavus]